MHPRMSAIAPQVAGIGVSAADMPNFHLFVNAFSRSVGKGEDKAPIPIWEMERQMMPETLAGGYLTNHCTCRCVMRFSNSIQILRGLSPSERKRWLWIVTGHLRSRAARRVDQASHRGNERHAR